MAWGLKENRSMYRPHLGNLIVPQLPVGYQELRNAEELLSQWAGLLSQFSGGHPVARLKAERLPSRVPQQTSQEGENR
jgi:hypothetical protein